WLAPEQARVLSLSEKVEGYAGEIADILKKQGFRANADIRNEKLGFKVREAELQKVPYMIVVGEREAESRSVSLRVLRGAKNETMPLDELAARCDAYRGIEGTRSRRGRSQRSTARMPHHRLR